MQKWSPQSSVKVLQDSKKGSKQFAVRKSKQNRIFKKSISKCKNGVHNQVLKYFKTLKKAQNNLQYANANQSRTEFSKNQFQNAKMESTIKC